MKLPGRKDTDHPYKRLASEIIISAVKDLRGRNDENKQSARFFFRSFWFDNLAELACVDPELVRDALGIPQRY